jgi:hypothetical protein
LPSAGSEGDSSWLARDAGKESGGFPLTSVSTGSSQRREGNDDTDEGGHITWLAESIAGVGITDGTIGADVAVVVEVAEAAGCRDART